MRKEKFEEVMKDIGNADLPLETKEIVEAALRKQVIVPATRYMGNIIGCTKCRTKDISSLDYHYCRFCGQALR